MVFGGVVGRFTDASTAAAGGVRRGVCAQGEFPSQAEAIADTVVDLTYAHTTSGALVEHRIAIRSGATAMLRAFERARIRLKVVTCNLLGDPLMRRIGERCGGPWAGLGLGGGGANVVVVTSRAAGAKSVVAALNGGVGGNGGDGGAAGSAPTPSGNIGEHFPPDRIAILDDSPEAWCADDRGFVLRVPRYDVRKGLSVAQLEVERRCLADLGARVLARFGLSPEGEGAAVRGR